MRIDVVGPGAIGLSMAALLHAAGEDVALVAREDQLLGLSGGVRLTGVAAEKRANVAVLSAARREADLVLLAVKTQDVDAAARRIPPGPGAIVVLANGLVADRLAARALPARRIVPAVVVYDAVLESAAHANLQRRGSLLLPSNAPAEADVLARALPIERRKDFVGARWTKLLVNLGNGLNAATGKPAQEAYRGIGARLGARLLAEGVAVAKAEGIELAPIPWADPRHLRILAALPPRIAGPLIALKVRATFRDVPAVGSTLQSLRRGKPTEVRYLNGAIVERGSARGIATPVNRAVVEAVENVEKGGAFASAEALAGMAGPYASGLNV